MGFKRWDIVRVPAGGPGEHRPALVIVAGEILKHHNLLWVLMITSAQHRFMPGDVEIADIIAAGLGVPSIIRTAKILTIQAGEAEFLGTLLGPPRRQVSEQVFAHMGLTGVS